MSGALVSKSTILSGWGRYSTVACRVMQMRDVGEARRALTDVETLIPFGNGRSYGDAALNPDGVLDTRPSDRITAFDQAEGKITCEGGLMLADLIDFALPRDLFPPVTPGTKFVTIGGMIAADVHGKNHHHAGTFGRHVLALTLLTADGAVRDCSPDDDPELFHATCGGMGLTGIILTATIRLLRVATGYIRQETVRAPDLDAAMAACEASSEWPYTVAWIDCVTGGARLGRALIYRGAHATSAEVTGLSPIIHQRLPRRLPFGLASFALSPWAVQAFNEIYYRSATTGIAIVDYDRYFYPLDTLGGWNRLYGRAGFLQYQCVVPLERSRPALLALIETIGHAGTGSFLAVLKRLGDEGPGYLSFPLAGYTLALDFPATQRNLALLDRLDDIVADHGGRLYLAKDARQSAAMVHLGYQRLDAFRAVRQRVDPDGKFTSLMARRLGL